MPFKSEAQRRKFGQLVSEGKMSQDTFDKWQSETKKKKLPERVTQKKMDSIPKMKSVDDIRAAAKKKYGV